MMNTDLKDNEFRKLMIEKGIDPDTIHHWIEEQLKFSRETDNLLKQELGREEFYKRERTHVIVELFSALIKH